PARAVFHVTAPALPHAGKDLLRMAAAAGRMARKRRVGLLRRLHLVTGCTGEAGARGGRDVFSMVEVGDELRGLVGLGEGPERRASLHERIDRNVARETERTGRLVEALLVGVAVVAGMVAARPRPEENERPDRVGDVALLALHPFREMRIV